MGKGWRSAMVAEPVRALVEGRAVLAFDGADRLVLEERSGRPLSRRGGGGGEAGGG